MSFNLGRSKHSLYKVLISSSIFFISLTVLGNDEELKGEMNRPLPPMAQKRFGVADAPGIPFHSFIPSNPFPPFIHQLQLTEQQRDKLFELSIAQAPAMYEKTKTIRHLETELAKQMGASSIDTNTIYAVADKLAQANADLMRIQIKNEIELRKMLSPSQKEQLNHHRDDSALLFEHHREMAFDKAPPPPRSACD